MTKNNYETPDLTPILIEVGGIICVSAGTEDYTVTDYDWTGEN